VAIFLEYMRIIGRHEKKIVATRYSGSEFNLIFWAQDVVAAGLSVKIF
jgi:hypothetical protein